MTLNNVGSPSDSNASGGGITIKGTADKTITFTNSTGDFDISENIDIASGKTYKINGTSVLSNNTLGSGVTASSLTSVGTIGTGTWEGTAVDLTRGGTGLVGATDGKITVADGSGAPVAVQVMTANDGTLKHEVGGIEADISGIAKGGLVVGTGTGTMDVKAVGTNDYVLTAASGQTGGVTWAAVPSTATLATTVTITDNESTDEDNAIIFTADGDVDGGNLGLESDGTLTYNPSTGKITATGFIGALTGNVTGNATGSALTVTQAAQTSITSVGTLTGLTVDNIAMDDKTITMTGSSGDTGTIVVAADGVLTVGTNDAGGDAAHFTVDADGDITLDAHSGIFKFNDGAFGGEILRITESGSGDVTIKLETNAKDLIFTDNGDVTGLTIKDDAAGIVVPGEVMTTKVSYTDGTDAMTVASGGGVTFAAGVTADSGVSIDNITIDGTEIDLSSGDLTLDVAGDIILDADGDDVTFKAGSGDTTGLAFTNSSGSWTLKPGTSDSDFTIAGNDGGSNVNALVFDMSAAGKATFNDVVVIGDGKLTLGSTAVTATGTELNLIDGGTSVGSSITVADADGFVVNDDGAMKTIPASDIKTYAGGGGGIYTLKSETTLTGGETNEITDVFEVDADYIITIDIAQQSQSGTPYPYIKFFEDSSNTAYAGHAFFQGRVHNTADTDMVGSGNTATTGAEWTLSCGVDANDGIHQQDDAAPGYHGVFYFQTPRNDAGTNQATDYKGFSGTFGYRDMAGYMNTGTLSIGFDNDGSIYGFGVNASAEYPGSTGAPSGSTHSSNSISSGWEGMVRVFKIDHS